MKQCPKCENIHDKPGIFCSRKCANSRVFSDASKMKKSNALKGRQKADHWMRSNPEKMREMQARIKVIKQAKSLATPFDKLGRDGKRQRVIESQRGACNRCNLTEWQGESIMIELDHIDGNNKNDVRSNLVGLCPNCHAMTHTWRGRKDRGKQKI